MKLLMATCADESVMEYARYTLPILRMYAKRWDAEFRILGKSFGSLYWWRTLALYDLLKSYDRILHIDSDIVINKNCPNIFDFVPHDTMGFVFEDKGSRLKNRRARIAHIKEDFGGNENWISGYFNIGFFVVSSMHRKIFTRIEGKLWSEKRKERLSGATQTHYSYQLMKQRHKYIDLGYKWNHMSMFSEPWNNRASRFDSYIIHYAGGGRFPDKGNRSRVQLMKDDIMKIYGRLEIEE